MMKKFLPYFLIAIGISSSLGVSAQLNYTVSFPTTTFTALTAPKTNAPLVNLSRVVDGAATSDEGGANNITLPFTFAFNGINYTKMNICTNGFLTLGAAPLDTFSALFVNNLANGSALYSGNPAVNRPIIAPLWDDLDMQLATNVSYKTTGTAPNRVLTVEWLNAKWDWQAAGACISFQARLFETTNVIEFVYRQQVTALSFPTASIGLADTARGAGNFLSMSGVTSAATNSFTTETTNISVKPANNFTIRFTPIVAPVADALLTNLTAPSFFVSCFSSNKDVSVTVNNKGTNPIAAGAASVKLDITGTNVQNFTKTNAAAIPPGGSEVLTYSVNLNVPTAGVSDVITAIATLAGDTRKSNDTVRRSSNTADLSSGPFPIIDTGNFALLSWLRTIEGSNFWTFRSSPFFAAPYFASTAGLSDSIRGNGDNNFYMFVPRASQGVSRAFIYSDCISLPTNGAPSDYNLSFYMTHDSSRPSSTRTDSLAIMVSSDGGQVWNRVGDAFPRTLSGYLDPAYQQDSVSLAAFSGQTIQVAFMGIGAFGNMFGLDDIQLGTIVLPVKMTAFAGYKEGNRNILEWSTATEQNNKGFELQRSIDGKEFKAISFISSKGNNGNSSSPLSYSFVDFKPSNGNNYYRLRQVDINGKETFSSIVLLNNVSTKVEVAKVYPNPVTDKLNLTINSSISEKLTVTITDLFGKNIETKVFESRVGENNFILNVNNLAKGSYVVKVSSNYTEITTQKFVKQ